MSQNRRVTGPLVDQVLDELLLRIKERSALTPKQLEKRAKERERIQVRKPQRVTYDLPPALRETIKQLAQDEGVPASQLVTLALGRFWQDYAAGRVDVGAYKRPSRSPRYDWVLSIPEELIPKGVNLNRREELSKKSR